MREWLARILGGLIERLGVSAAPINDNNLGWSRIPGEGGPADRAWWEIQLDLSDVLDAWRRNFLVRQIVRLTTAFVVGDGVAVSSLHPWVAGFVDEFWTDPQNKIGGRLASWCDELTRSGELYLALFPNRVNGMQYVRAIPASQIDKIITDPNDYEKELQYREVVPGEVEGKLWDSMLTAEPKGPVLLHYCINKPVGATRGEGDLTPILPWAKRYTSWLKDRVEFNRLRNELAGVDIEIEDGTKVEEKRRYYEVHPPIAGSITVHGRDEKISYPSANIQGYDAEPDGRALRLAFAAGANVPLHFLAEGSSATRSTATEMGDPTHRHYRMRQQDFIGILTDLVGQAYRRYCAVLELRLPVDLRITVDAPDVSRADNQALASSASTIVGAFATMAQNGWIDDETAIRLSFKFAGEILPEEKIEELLKVKAKPKEVSDDDGDGSDQDAE